MYQVTITEDRERSVSFYGDTIAAANLMAHPYYQASKKRYVEGKIDSTSFEWNKLD